MCVKGNARKRLNSIRRRANIAGVVIAPVSTLCMLKWIMFLATDFVPCALFETRFNHQSFHQDFLTISDGRENGDGNDGEMPHL